MFTESLKNFILSNNLSGSSIAVAISGGSDSVALIYGLHQLSQELSLRLSAIHVNYHLRGDDSNKDELLVRDICTSLDIPLNLLNSSLEGRDTKVEEIARDIRYSWFFQLKELNRLDYIAVGHTLEDQAETVLFRLLRGSSLFGLSGMEEIRDDGIIRPMLNISKGVIKQWATEKRLRWREDSSNLDSKYKRNLIRNQITPLLNGVNSSALEHIVQFSKEAARLNREVDAVGYERLKSRGLSVKENHLHFLKGEISAMEMSWLSSALRSLGLNLSSLNLQQIEELNRRSGRELLLPNGWRGYSSFKRIHIYHKSEDIFPKSYSINGINQSTIYRVPKRINEISEVRVVNEADTLKIGQRVVKALTRLKKMGVPSFQRRSYPVIISKDSTVYLADAI